MSETVFFVAGIPATKGSIKSFPFRRKNGKLGVSSFGANPRTKDWQLRIATEAQAHDVPFAVKDQAVELGLTFWLPRPKYLSKKKYRGVVVPHTKTPDIDKLLRAALDALKGIAYADDSQVRGLVADKMYAEEGRPCGVEVVVKIDSKDGTEDAKRK